MRFSVEGKIKVQCLNKHHVNSTHLNILPENFT